MLNMLNESSYVLPFHSKVKINELKVSTYKGYCNKFQIGKCTFRDDDDDDDDRDSDNSDSNIVCAEDDENLGK